MACFVEPKTAYCLTFSPVPLWHFWFSRKQILRKILDRALKSGMALYSCPNPYEDARPLSLYQPVTAWGLTPGRGMTLGQIAFSNSDIFPERDHLVPSASLQAPTLSAAMEMSALVPKRDSECWAKMGLNFPIWVQSGRDLVSLCKETNTIPSNRRFT